VALCAHFVFFDASPWVLGVPLSGLYGRVCGREEVFDGI